MERNDMKKYIQIYNSLRREITDKKLPAGSKLETETQIAERYDISRQTVRQALSLLRQEGFIYSVQGSGSFVAAREDVIQSKRIGVLTTYYSEYIFPEILRSIGEEVSRNGYTIELNTTNNSIAAEKKVLQMILQKPVAGLIVEGTKSALPNPNISYYRQLSSLGIPIVFINGIYPNLNGSNIISVTMDDEAGARLIVDGLLSEGYKNIGCILKSDDIQGYYRFSGIIQTLVSRGADYDDKNFLWYTTETKHSFLLALEGHSIFRECDAIICYNDEIAEMVAAYLPQIEHRVKVIVSFDRQISPVTIPRNIGFYSIPHPKGRLGTVAAQKLINMLSGKPETSEKMDWRIDLG